MWTRLRMLTVALGLVGCLLAAGLAREVLTAHPLPPPPAPRTARLPAAAPTATAAAPASAATYGVIATKNLFSPSRTEVPAGPVVAAGLKPLLHGVIMDGPKSRAYLEDPALKHTFGYLVGDTVGGGRVESIAPDRVVIGRGDGFVEVLLRDPSKPRPAAGPPAAVGSTPGALVPAGPGALPSAPSTGVPAAAVGSSTPPTQAGRK